MTQADMKYYFALFWVDLYKLCNELGLDGEQKKDVIAEAFVDLWKMRDTVIGNKNIKAFLYTTTRRYALEILKK